MTVFIGNFISPLKPDLKNNKNLNKQHTNNINNQTVSFGISLNKLGKTIPVKDIFHKKITPYKGSIYFHPFKQEFYSVINGEKRLINIKQNLNIKAEDWIVLEGKLAVNNLEAKGIFLTDYVEVNKSIVSEIVLAEKKAKIKGNIHANTVVLRGNKDTKTFNEILYALSDMIKGSNKALEEKITKIKGNNKCKPTEIKTNEENICVDGNIFIKNNGMVIIDSADPDALIKGSIKCEEGEGTVYIKDYVEFNKDKIPNNVKIKRISTSNMSILIDSIKSEMPNNILPTQYL